MNLHQEYVIKPDTINAKFMNISLVFLFPL